MLPLWPPGGKPTSVRSRSEKLKLKHVGGVPACSAHNNAHNTEDARVQGEESRIESPLQRDLKGVNAATRVLKHAAPNTWTCATAALEV
jgi:hypothetical protein